MKKALVLDCTLRDGGYINNFSFGYDTIKDIINSLAKARIDVIECGFLRDGSFDNNHTLYDDVKSVNKHILIKSNSLFVAMVQLGKFNLENLPPYSGDGISGIRLTFHKNEIADAIAAGNLIKKKGYMLFFQPVGTTSYSDEEMAELLIEVNELNPNVFYIVDTLGVMDNDDVLKVFRLVDKKLNKSIQLGFHSHNNLQLSFSNAISIFSSEIDRDIYVDSSLNGMGRGAGNLCTELICSYLNDKTGANYDTDSLIQLIDNYISPLKSKFRWGYSIAYYLSAINNCHPNYATFLLNKKTLTISDISLVLRAIPMSERELFDESLIKRLYFSFLNKFDSQCNYNNTLNSLRRIFENKDVLVIAPGKKSITEAKRIQSFIKTNDCITMGVNENYKFAKLDYIFVSNKKKLKMMNSVETRLILTTNLFEERYKKQIVVDYKFLSFENSNVKDNAGLMCLRLLDHLNVNNIYLAGFDGFTPEDFSYKFDDINDNLRFVEQINSGIKDAIHTINKNIIFLTKSIYE